MVAVIMGSINDKEVARSAVEVLKEFGLDYEVKVISAHRTPEVLEEYIKGRDKEIDVYIAIAGLSAHLPGVIASKTVKPVIGVPIASGPLNGMDALLSIVQMPPGIPVATVGISNARNAGLLAVQIIALKKPELQQKLIEYRQKQKERVYLDNKKLEEEVW